MSSASFGRQAADGEGARMGRKHVFAVAVSPDFLDVLRDLLQEERYNVTTANFVPRTFDQVAALQPDLLIVDLVVGQRAGWDLLERLHAEAATRGLPVLLVSTDDRFLERAAAEGARYGAHAALAKPFDLQVLLDSIDALIGPT